MKCHDCKEEKECKEYINYDGKSLILICDDCINKRFRIKEDLEE